MEFGKPVEFMVPRGTLDYPVITPIMPPFIFGYIPIEEEERNNLFISRDTTAKEEHMNDHEIVPVTPVLLFERALTEEQQHHALKRIFGKIPVYHVMVHGVKSKELEESIRKHIKISFPEDRI